MWMVRWNILKGEVYGEIVAGVTWMLLDEGIRWIGEEQYQWLYDFSRWHLTEQSRESRRNVRERWKRPNECWIKRRNNKQWMLEE
jgi:hypothetical protein